MENEIWKTIPGYEGYYEASDQGRIRSINREVKYKYGVRKLTGKLMTLGLTEDGYLQTTLNRNKIHRCFRVHQLIAMTFLNHKPDGGMTVVHHINSNTIDNRLINLKVITQRENCSIEQTLNTESGITGVSRNTNKWLSRIQINGINVYLGRFESKFDAAFAYQLSVTFQDRFDGDTSKFRNFIKSKMD